MAQWVITTIRKEIETQISSPFMDPERQLPGGGVCVKSEISKSEVKALVGSQGSDAGLELQHVRNLQSESYAPVSPKY
jgi:hypothetical protein